MPNYATGLMDEDQKDPDAVVETTADDFLFVANSIKTARYLDKQSKAAALKALERLRRLAIRGGVSAQF